MQLKDLPAPRILDMSFEEACDFILQIRERRRAPRKVARVKKVQVKKSNELKAEIIASTMTPSQIEKLKQLLMKG